MMDCLSTPPHATKDRGRELCSLTRNGGIPRILSFLFYAQVYTTRRDHIYELVLFWYQKRGLYSVLI
jgi:hypothetical protein